MMNLNLSKGRLLASSLLMVLATYSVIAPAATRADASCKLIQGDIYDEGQKMPNGLSEGGCVDTTRKRAPIIISEDSQKIVIANFRHNNRWYTAEIPKDGVNEAIYQMRKFKSLPFIVAAHSQIRFVMKPGMSIKLTSQNDSEGPRETTSIKDLTYSVEYAAPKGVQYDPVAGLTYNFQQVGRVMSTQDVMFEKLGDPRVDIIQLKLKGGPQLASAILDSAIHKTAEAGLGEPYNTWSANCTTEAFDRIDEGVEKVTGQKPARFKMSGIRDAVVGPSIKALKARGLIDDSSQLPDLRSEARSGNFLPSQFLTENVTQLENTAPAAASANGGATGVK